MADTNVRIEGGESPAQVAYTLLREIIEIEGGFKDRKTLLDAYAECIHATKGYRDIPSRSR